MIKKILSKDYVRFVIVGVLNTIIGTFTMFFFYNFVHAGYWVSSALNYIVGSIFSYFANKYFTFKKQGKDVKEIIKFVINIAVCYLVAYGLSRQMIRYFLTTFFAIQNVRIVDQVSMLGGMCLFVILNYLGQKIVVFRMLKDNE